jgi:hypothetical protein
MSTSILSDPFQRQQDVLTASLQLTDSRASQKPFLSRTSQPKLWHAPSWPAGYHASVARRPSPPTRDVSLSHSSSTPWPSSVAFNFLGQPHIIPQLTDSWNAFTGPSRPPSCAMQTNIGLRCFPWFFSASAPHSKRICKHHQLSSCTENHWESPASSKHRPHTLLNQRTSSHNCTSTWLASDQFHWHATPVQEHLCTRISITAHISSSVRTQRARLWNLLIAAPTKPCLGKRKCCNCLCAASPSPCQLTGSSRPTYQRGRLQEHSLQPCGQSNSSHSTTGQTTDHITAYSYLNYALRSSCPLPRPLQQSDIRQMSVIMQRLVPEPTVRYYATILEQSQLWTETAFSVGSALTLQLGAVTEEE